MALVQLSNADGSWTALRDQWERELAPFEDSLDSYLIGTIEVLEGLIKKPEPNAGVFSWKDGDDFAVVCQMNTTPLPGYNGPVLRTRFLTLSPKYDLEETTLDAYGRVIVNALHGAVSPVSHPAEARVLG